MRVGGDEVDIVTLGPDPTDKHFTKAELDSLFLFADSAGCKVLLGLNLRYNNPPLADTEANYVIQNHPGQLFGFEVGNEPDKYVEHLYRIPPPA